MINQLRQIKTELASHPLTKMREEVVLAERKVNEKIFRRFLALLMGGLSCFGIGATLMVYDNILALIPFLLAPVMLVSAVVLGFNENRLATYYMKKLGFNRFNQEMEDYVLTPDNQRELMIESNKIAPFAKDLVEQFKMSLMEKNASQSIELFLKLENAVIGELEKHDKTELLEAKKKSLQKFEESLGLSEIEIEHNGTYDYKKII